MAHHMYRVGNLIKTQYDLYIIKDISDDGYYLKVRPVSCHLTTLIQPKNVLMNIRVCDLIEMVFNEL